MEFLILIIAIEQPIQLFRDERGGGLGMDLGMVLINKTIELIPKWKVVRGKAIKCG